MLVVYKSDFSDENPLEQQENLLEKQENLLETVFNRIPLPTFVLDINHTIIFWNKALEQLTNKKRSEMIGTQNQWIAFYATERPTLADLIIEGGKDEAVSQLYENKYKASALIEDAYEAEDFFPDIGEKGEWLSFTAASITDATGKVIGAIETLTNISNEKHSQIALQQSEERYKQLSITDTLTGLYNRRHFTEKMIAELERTKRYNQYFALCIIDLDNFKMMNDAYGHLFGDQILQKFGSMIKNNLRKTDTAYRYGGEEFAIIFPGTSLEGAVQVANRIRVELSVFAFANENSEKRIRATASFGIGASSAADCQIEQIIKRADKALYIAKKTGKNKIEILRDAAFMSILNG